MFLVIWCHRSVLKCSKDAVTRPNMTSGDMDHGCSTIFSWRTLAPGLHVDDESQDPGFLFCSLSPNKVFLVKVLPRRRWATCVLATWWRSGFLHWYDCKVCGVKMLQELCTLSANSLFVTLSTRFVWLSVGVTNTAVQPWGDWTKQHSWTDGGSLNTTGDV